MIAFSVKTPTIPIPFHRLFKMVALVDREDPQPRRRFDRTPTANFDIEVSNAHDGAISEDARGGACICQVQGVLQGRIESRIRFYTYVVRQ